MFILLMLFSSLGAQAFEKKIVSNACVMSYTDTLAKMTRVIRGDPIVIFLK
jgi:hypothetical protein